MSNLRFVTRAIITSLFLIFAVTGAQIVQAQQVTPVYAGPPVTLPPTHGVCGIYTYQEFTGAAGQVLTGSVSASSAVNVYLMTGTEFNAWRQETFTGATCTPVTEVTGQLNTTSYSLDATIPVTGTYYLVVNNLSGLTVTAQIIANLTG